MFENFESFINEKDDELLKALNDIKSWVVDEQNPKKYKYLLQNIDYAIELAKNKK